ncbi:isochorismatase family protein [Hirschia litorea]|uniref:Isochorismatase family protein n=1 Tax=Hirschia litorea TaxID=1199156 RepID=A0ABW2IN99_9PROT
MHITPQSALIIVDVQKAIDLPYWGVRNNIDAEMKMRSILEMWRNLGYPIFHIQHNSNEEASGYNPARISHAFKDETVPINGEVVIGKSVHSAFVGTDLTQRLHQLAVDEIFMFGVKTNNSIETSVRHGANLGFDILLIEDACFTHNQKDWNGKLRSAEDVHAMTLSNLEGEYCRVVTSSQVLNAQT